MPAWVWRDVCSVVFPLFFMMIMAWKGATVYSVHLQKSYKRVKGTAWND